MFKGVFQAVASLHVMSVCMISILAEGEQVTSHV